MAMVSQEPVFAGAVPAFYDRVMVPLVFAPWAPDLVARIAARPLGRVLELAAGTGVVTRELARTLPASVTVVATDLSPGMVAQAEALGTERPVEWRTADAMSLPFEDAGFDAVVCQFGAMFFPDKAQAFAEALRVLRPGGVFAFSVWDRIETSPLADIVTRALAGLFPDDPPRFLARTPHGYHDRGAIAGDVARAGFARAPAIETLERRSRADSCRTPAVAFCQGTLLRNEIEARAPGRLAEATDVAAEALERRYGSGPVDAPMQAHVVVVER